MSTVGFIGPPDWDDPSPAEYAALSGHDTLGSTLDATGFRWTLEEIAGFDGPMTDAAIELGRGVCQDHAHIFIAAARAMDYPARYVSGYLMMNDRTRQDASHAWAEAHIGGLGWVGFDVSNGISPDARYVRVATGLDYREAAPVAGLRYGDGSEAMDVEIVVAQQ